MQPKARPCGVAQAAFVMIAALAIPGAAALAQDKGAVYEGKSVRFGNGEARTVVRTGANGQAVSIGVVLTEEALEGLPSPAKGASADFPYLLPMPRKGPRTVVDHVVVNWESLGHPPAKVYDVPHFDFHFYLVGRAQRQKVRFKSDAESGSPGQQPPAHLLAPGYVVPPGTAVSGMGVHAINPASPEFNGQPFTATFIYGYHDKRQIFLEPMVTLSYLKSKPSFSAPVPRPASFMKAGAYPASYSVRYHEASKSYEVSLEGLQ